MLGVITILTELNVKNVIIGKQFENSDNYEEFVNVVKEKNIKVYVVEAGAKIDIEEKVFFNVLWPDSTNVISQNSINNNALVCKLYYKNFTMLFTGDIENEAEKIMIYKYKDTNFLSSSVLKVAHHGSKTSSIQNFIELVNPKIALIGVGKNNNFGHPSSEVLDRLENCGAKIYRTDENGEITIIVNDEIKNILYKFNKNVNTTKRK